MRRLFDNKLFKVFSLIVEILFIVVFSMYLFFLLIEKISDDRSIFGYRIFTLTNYSMTDIYDKNDMLIIKDADITNLKVDDDVAYIGERGGLNGTFVISRIVKIEKENNDVVVITRGINSNVDNPSISNKKIIGKVVGKLPIVTQLNHIAKNRFYCFLLFFCPLLLIIIIEIIKTLKEIKSENVGCEEKVDDPIIVSSIDVNESVDNEEPKIISFEVVITEKKEEII